MRWEDRLCQERENQGFRLAGALRARPFGDFLAFAAGAADFCGWAFFVGADILDAFCCFAGFLGAADFGGCAGLPVCFAFGACLEEAFFCGGFFSGWLDFCPADSPLRGRMRH